MVGIPFFTGLARSECAAHRARDHQFFVRANDAKHGPGGVRGNHSRSLRIARLIQCLRPGLDANPVFLMRFGNGSKVPAQMIDIPDQSMG